MRRLGIVAVGLALMVGIILGGMVGNPFDGTASAAPPKPTPTPQPSGRLINLGSRGGGDCSLQLLREKKVEPEAECWPFGITAIY